MTFTVYRDGYDATLSTFQTAPHCVCPEQTQNARQLQKLPQLRCHEARSVLARTIQPDPTVAVRFPRGDHSSCEQHVELKRLGGTGIARPLSLAPM